LFFNFQFSSRNGKDQINKQDILFHFRDENDYIVRPLPHVKRNLSEPVLLYQIVQLLLTYDPAIVQRVASLLLHILEP
uniref:Protein SDA1 n=1 Tax=Onchocerca flexuosa TaxID=387005 RepID=A0A183HSD3_9BILA